MVDTILEDFNDTTVSEIQTLPQTDGNKLTWGASKSPSSAVTLEELESVPLPPPIVDNTSDEEFIMVEEVVAPSSSVTDEFELPRQ